MVRRLSGEGGFGANFLFLLDSTMSTSCLMLDDELAGGGFRVLKK